MTSVYRGQPALIGLPNTAAKPYNPPSRLLSGKFEVMKVTKDGTRSARIIRISESNRSLQLTYSKKTLLKSGTVKAIYISQIDRVTTKSNSKRFIAHAEKNSKNLNRAIQHKDSFVSQKISVMHAEAEGCGLSIVYYQKAHSLAPITLDLILRNEKEHDLLYSALTSLILDYKRHRSKTSEETLFIEYCFENYLQVDPVTTSDICFSDMVKALHGGLKNMISSAILKQSSLAQLYRQYFSLLSMPSNDARVPFEQAVQFYRYLRRDVVKNSISPLHTIWEAARGPDNNDDQISAQEFLKFMTSVQKEGKWSLEFVQEIFDRLNAVNMSCNDPALCPQSSKAYISRSVFEAYIRSDANDVFDPVKGILGRYDMTYPLSHYYINTSHRTYLRDDQVTADVQLYAEALYRGCRCVSADVWDYTSGEDKEPVVCKEGTSKSRVLFSSVLKAIKAFLHTNPESFPVVLSVENHCSPPFQEKMASYLVMILGRLLYVPAEFDGPLLSPESLRGKVVIKARRPPKLHDDVAFVATDDFDINNQMPFADGQLQASLTTLSTPSEFEFDHNGDNFEGTVEQEVLNLTKEAKEARKAAQKAEEHAFNLSVEAKQAVSLAEKLLGKLGLSMVDVEGKSVQAIQEAIDSGSLEPIDCFSLSPVSNGPSSSPTTTVDSPLNSDQGVEINKYSDDAMKESQQNVALLKGVLGSKTTTATIAAGELQDASEEFYTAKEEFEVADKANNDAQETATQAALAARMNREHSDTSRRRIDTVEKMVQQCKDSAASSEGFSITALTEKKISEQRAKEAESRAQRALKSAAADKERANEETKKEDHLVEEANLLKRACDDATVDARKARERMDKATADLDSIDDNLNIDIVLNGTKANTKQKALTDEKRRYTVRVKETSAENAAAEMIRRHAQNAYDEARHRAKVQAGRSSEARKRAEHSATIADRLAEHAEEERAAADLRKVANDKADISLEQIEQELRSSEAQLQQARRAYQESEDLARASRDKAEELTEMAILARMTVTEKNSLVITTQETLNMKNTASDKAEREKIFAAKELKEAESALSTLMEFNRRSAVEDTEKVHKNNAHALQVRDALKTASKALALATLSKKVSTEAALATKNALDMEYQSRSADSTRRKFGASLPIAPAFSRLVTFSTNKFKSWDKANVLANSEMLSVSDSNTALIARIGSEDRGAWVEFNCSRMSRIFPSSQKIGSSNTNPVMAWSMGCQLVAQDLQICDAELMVNDGRFRENGSCGYVLKSGRLTSPKKYEGAAKERSKTVKVRVLSGSCLHYSNGSGKGSIDPFVNIVVCDGITGKISTCQTGVVKRNGLNPIWEENPPAMFAVDSPNLAMIIFSVWDDKEDKFIASASMPFRGLKQGYRSVPLFDESHSRLGSQSFSSLLVEVRFEQ